MGGLTLRYRLGWIGRYLFSHDSLWSAEAERKRHFRRMTGLHSTWARHGPLTDPEIIAIQARKIAALETQRTQLTKGFTRKITKLQHEVRRLTASAAVINKTASKEAD